MTRASTVLYRDTAHLRETAQRRAKGERNFSYGAKGTPTTFALEDALTEVEGGDRTQLFPTGLAAIAHVFLSVLKPGDHVLLGETLYGPARDIAEKYLGPRGIACEFYPGGAAAAGEVARRLKPETRLVYPRQPRLDRLRRAGPARHCSGGQGEAGALVGVDNTWGAAGLYRPLALGADISVVALTKYIAGHSDITMGSVTAKGAIADQLWRDSHSSARPSAPTTPIRCCAACAPSPRGWRNPMPTRWR